MDVKALREQALERDGSCVWPGCVHPQHDLQLAHLTHRGLGGSEEANRLDNVAMLCRYHHDVLDGRTRNGRRRAVLDLLLAFLEGQDGIILT